MKPEKSQDISRVPSNALFGVGSGHCRPDYRPWEQRNTCYACAAPLADNQLVKDARIANNTASWAKLQLRILADMADDRGLPEWVAVEARRICDGIRLLSPNA